TIFDDATPSDFQLGCTGDACPTGGFEGRLRTAVEFNEIADVLTLNQPALSAAATGFSVSLWVYPTQTKDTAQSIVTIANGANTQPRAAISFAPNSTYLTVQNTANMATIPQSNVQLIKNTWNQVTLVVERNASNTGENYYLYINGYLDSSWAVAQVNTGLGKITLGNASAVTGLQAGPYTGKIDEVAVYEYALNEIDIRETFAYQMGQVEETASLTMTIDADDPQAELISFNPSFPYMDENDRVLHVEATDATSGIGMIEMQVTHANAPATEWDVAPVCLDAPGGTAFCPTFIPQHGEGAYTLSFRAVDQVGNQATSDEYVFLVDASEPNVFVNLVEGSLQKAEPHPSMPNTWFLHMQGQVVDEILNQGQPGSGLDLDSMKVTVYSENNEVAGKGAQVPTLVPVENGYDWSLDYLFPEAEPTGALTVVIEVKDLVGNQAAHTVHVLLDATAPSAVMESNQLLAGDGFDPLSLFDVNTQDEKMLSGGNVSGSVNDTPGDGIPYMTPNGKLATSGVKRVEAALEPSIGASYLFNEPYPEGLLAWLPLDDAKAPDGASGTPDESAAERYFLDISPFQFSGFCAGANCPINGETGHKNGSIYFDGQEKFINLGSKVDLANRSFSALVWARRDAAGHSDPFLWQGPFANPEQRFLFGLDYQDRLVCGFGGTDLLTADAFTDTGWHAYACTYDLDSGRRVIYRDGQEVARDTAGAVPAMSEDLLIGYAPVGSFAGSLDELMVLDRALSAEEVRTAYTGYQAVYHLAIDETFLSNGDLILDDSGYFHTGTLLSGEGDSTNKVVAGAVGSYGLHFDGNERFVGNPAFSLALDRGAFTQTAWVKPANDAGAGAIISQLDANPEQRYPSIYLTDQCLIDDQYPNLQLGLIAGFGDLYDWNELATVDCVVQPGVWNFVAARFDGTTYSLFVNGVEVAQTSALQGKLPYPADRFNLGEGFAGDIDDVQIFTRPLSNGEIVALAQTGWRSADLSGSTWSAPVLFGLEGSYRVDVRGWDNQGHFDTGWDVDHQWSGIVDTLAPRFSFTRTIDPDDPNLAHFRFSVEDTLLDKNSIRQNLCQEVQWTREYFNSSWYLATGVPPNTSLYRLSGSCTGDTRTTQTTGFYACDIAGNCVMQEYPPTMPNTVYLPFVMGGNAAGAPSSPSVPQISPDQLERALQWPTLTDTQDRSDGGQAPHVEIWTTELTPEDARSIFHANLKGMVSDDDGQVDSVQVEVILGGEVIYTTTAGVYNGLWNAMWFYPPGGQPANGAYTVRVTAVDAAGNPSQVEQDVRVHLLP
ncbi:MAG TPA: LamG-like jellyroll fold domain-containing protein, partial [Anaerolineaceae bacterium]|nr:LamG-like jellyroll fold domain-containing protein [Anaerolineaceae bacterium]